MWERLAPRPIRRRVVTLMLKLADLLESIVVRIGRAVAWLTLFMVVLTVIVVVLRYFFSTGWIWMQELVTWAHAAVFLLGAAYTLARDEHVRVDVFYRQCQPAVRAWINIAGTVLLLFPVCGFLTHAGWRYAAKSWQRGEMSPETGGLGFPMIPLAKSLLVVMLVLLIAQGIVIVLRNLNALRTGQFAEPGAPGDVL